jgi:hypothetical protein
MLTGAIFSTRAISTSAGRRAPFDVECSAAPEASDQGDCETSRRIGLQLMVNDLAVEMHFD